MKEVEAMQKAERLEGVSAVKAHADAMMLSQSLSRSHTTGGGGGGRGGRGENMEEGFREDDDDIWMDNAEVLQPSPSHIAMPITQPVKRKTQTGKRMVLNTNTSSDTEAMAVHKENKSSTSAVPDGIAEPDWNEQEDGNLDQEHPSCDLREGCVRRGRLELPFYDPNTEPLQKGIVGSHPTADSAILASFVNAACASRLLPYQVTGVEWLWKKYALGQGAILGDDMGLGKTIQVLALLLAIYGKKGDHRDLVQNRERRSSDAEFNERGRRVDGYPSPCLIVVPASVVSNWGNELSTWGHFLHHCCSSTIEVEKALKKIHAGHLEVLVIGYSQLTIEKNRLALSQITWEVILFDEAHTLKNPKTHAYGAALTVGAGYRSRTRIALTGTPIQNILDEVWAILNVITKQRFQPSENFKDHFTQPMKNSMSTKYSGNQTVICLGQKRKKEFGFLMNDYMIARKKEGMLDILQLQSKMDWVVLSDLTSMQRELYEHLVSLPDCENMRYAKHFCPDNPEVRRKAHGNQNCCDRHTRPLDENGELDPRAVMWHQVHPSGEACPKCPSCISLSVINKLRNIYNDPALLQVKRAGGGKGSSLIELEDDKGYAQQALINSINSNIDNAHELHLNETEAKKSEFLRNSLSTDLLDSIGGVYIPTDIDLHAQANQRSGKLADLMNLLQRFRNENLKTLIFSESTQMLDIIQAVLKYEAFTFARLDGTTATPLRDGICKKFNKDQTNVMMISSKAGGMGLNLTGASRVVHFDVNWNPTVDQQASDRSFRIGQDKPVEIFHLVAKGTLEEVIYLRQMYKQTVQRTVDGGTAIEQVFEGIQGDSNTYGELFGMENIMQYTDYSLIEKLQGRYVEKQDQEQKAAEAEAHFASNIGATANATAYKEDADLEIGKIETQARIKTEKAQIAKMQVKRVLASEVAGGLQSIQNAEDEDAQQLTERIVRGVEDNEIRVSNDDERSGTIRSKAGSDASSSSSRGAKTAPVSTDAPVPAATKVRPNGRRVLPGTLSNNSSAGLARPY